MALSEIIINNEVQFQTSAAIVHSNYELLRKFILDRTPLAPVMMAITQNLTAHYLADKDAMVHQLTQDACQAQIINDIQDANTSEQERARDLSLIKSHTRDLPVQQHKQNLLDMKITHQQDILSQMRGSINEYKANLKGIDSALAGISKERAQLNSRYSSIPQQGNVHGHAQPVIVSNPTAPGVILYTEQDQLIWDRLYREENRINAERTRTATLITLKENEFSSAEANLIDTQRELRQVNQDVAYMKRSLDIELPENERQRQIRHQERTTREHARQNHAPALQQLSVRSHQELQRKIESKTHELNHQHNQLKTKAEELSYPEYLNQLEVALSREDGPQVTFYENQTLKSLLHMIKNFFELEGTEQVINQNLSEAQKYLNQLYQNQTQNGHEVERLIASNATLKELNLTLGYGNYDLEINKQTAENIRTGAIYASIIAGGGTLITAAIGAFLLLNPILFAIPAALGLVMLVAIGIAVAYHFIKSSNENKIEENTQTIRTNEETIEQQKQQMSLINAQTPELQSQITQAEQAVTGVKQQLTAHQSLMNSHMNKMHSMTSNPPSGNDFFFSSPNPGSMEDPTPSAPAYDPQTAKFGMY